MTIPKKPPVERTWNVKQELVGLELEAISLVLHHWALPAVVTRRKGEWEKKLPLFRKGLTGGMKPGSKESWPWEIAADELAVVMEAVNQIQAHLPGRNLGAWLPRQRLRIPSNSTGEHPEVDRPLPFPWMIRKWHRERGVGDVCEEKPLEELPWHNTAHPLALQLTAARLGVSVGKVKGAEKMDMPDNRRMKSSMEQKHLASIFLDLCSDDSGEVRELRAEVLDALYQSRYNLLGLEYLVQTAHSLDFGRIYCGKYDAGEVRRLCEAVRPAGGGQCGPFAAAMHL